MRFGRLMALQIFVLPGARRACRNRPAARGRARLPTYHDREACTMARMLASGAVAGMAQPAFRMNRSGGQSLPRFGFHERACAERYYGPGSRSRGLNEAIFAVDVGESHRFISRDASRRPQ